MAENWDRFKFEIGQANSVELTTVGHVVHVPSVRRIVEGGRIKAGLIYDENHFRVGRAAGVAPFGSRPG